MTGRDAERLHGLAAALAAAERERVGIRTFSQRPDAPNEAEAWEIAHLRDQIRLAQGAVATGYKLGWTSTEMRVALRIDRPNFGTLFDYMHVSDGMLPLARMIHPKAEPEFAFVADEPMSGMTLTDIQVMRAGRWALALEVVDPRWESYDFTWIDNTADGSSAAAYVTGPFREVAVPAEDLLLELDTGGRRVQGRGSAALGSPARAVAYLVAQLTSRGQELQAGATVLTGGVTAPVDLRTGMVLQVTSPHLPGCGLLCM